MFAVAHEPPFASLPREALELYGYAVQVIAAADGRLTREERELVFDDARRLGVTQDIIEAWSRFNWRSETVATILGKLKPHLDARMARRILYSAIRIALADELYAIDERAAIDEAADLLGVGASEIESLGALVRLEMGVAVLRRGLQLD
jgi:tellurite resistance protein